MLKKSSSVAILLVFALFVAMSIGGSIEIGGSTAFAYRTFYNSSISTEEYKIEFIGGQKGEQFGASLASGDINGDGIDDLIVGSPFYSSYGMTWNGRISIFFGTNELSKRVYDMKYDRPDLTVYGRNSGDQLGTSLASGNFNRDAYDDVLIGAYNASSDADRPGKAFLIYGRDYFHGKIWDLRNKPANKEFIGNKSGDGFGVSVYMADINHDHMDDILIGAPFSVSIDGLKSGNVYGYFGSTKDVHNVDGSEKLFGDEKADVVFVGHSEGERFGATMAFGDIIGNSYSDAVIGAYFADGPNGKQSGKVYIYKGLRQYPKYIRLADDALVGDQAYSWLGFSMSIGKFMSNNAEDLMISTFPYTDRGSRGDTYILHGRGSFSGQMSGLTSAAGTPLGNTSYGETSDASTSPFVVKEASADYVVHGGRGDNYLGASGAFSDMDGDGQEDFVLGAPGIGMPKSMDSGEVYVFYHNMLWNKVPFEVKNDEASAFVKGENPDDWFGSELNALNFNEDSFGDVAVSAKYADRYDDKGVVSESDNGKVYLLIGHSAPFGVAVEKKESTDDYVTRGEFISSVVDKFNIKEARKDFIDDCYAYRDFCFYNFSGISSYSGIKLNPNIVLYPDVPYGSKYYEPVTIGTMLGMINGYGGEKDTPFKPDEFITRIQALRIVLGINQLVKPLYKFELVGMLGSSAALQSQSSNYGDVIPSIPSMWWYPRFTNFAYENRLVDERQYFRPDDFITKGEFDTLVERTLTLINAEKNQ